MSDIEDQARPAKLRRLSDSADVSTPAAPLTNPPIAPAAERSVQDDAIHNHDSVATNTEHTSLQESHSQKPQEQDVLTIQDNLSSANNDPQTQPPLSKNQLKKQRRREEWEAGRDERKVKRRERNKEKRQRKRVTREEAEAEAEAASGGAAAGAPPSQPAPLTRPRAAQLPITFILDCGFDEYMMERERISLSSQITRCYADNAKAPFRAHLALSSFGGWMQQRFETVLHGHHKRWKGVRTCSEGFAEVAGMAREWMKPEQGGGEIKAALASQVKIGQQEQEQEEGEVVYLTADTDETLTELKPYSTYIIGGIVDKNRHKNLCYERARAAGVRTAKLPIGEYIRMSHRPILATNHVNEIMLRWLECGDWGEAFIRVLPQRKGGVLRSADGAAVGADGQGVEDGDEQGVEPNAQDGEHELKDDGPDGGDGQDGGDGVLNGSGGHGAPVGDQAEKKDEGEGSHVTVV